MEYEACKNALIITLKATIKIILTTMNTIIVKQVKDASVCAKVASREETRVSLGLSSRRKTKVYL